MDIISKRPLTIEPFILFGKAHLITVFVMIIISVLLLVMCKKSPRFAKNFKIYLLVSLIVQDLLYRLWGGFYQGVDLTVALTLHLSSMSVILAIVLLYKYKQIWFDLLFYWGLLAVPQAIITPGISSYGFPHLRFFHILSIHMTVMVVVFYFLIIEKRKPSKISLKRSLIITHLYGGFVFCVNMVFGTNYMFIGRKSSASSIINFLGPWPIYIVYLDIILIVMFTVLYLFYNKVNNY